MAVVDPGVGSSRRAILIQTGDRFFVGPDNGIFSYVCDTVGRDAASEDISSHEREILSPSGEPDLQRSRCFCAGCRRAFARREAREDSGTKMSDFVRLPPLKPATSRDGSIKARIIHIDRFRKLRD